MSTSATTVDVDAVLDPLREIESRGFNRYNIFRDWVSLMLLALERSDEPYLDILDGYDRGRDHDRGERTPDLFSEAFGHLQDQMQSTNRDVLGVCYEEFGMQNDAFGQHFTPENVCAMTAEMQTGEDPEPPVTVADPACGSGRLLVHMARRHDVATVSFGMDKDELCAQMAALNLCCFNMDGVVVCGDSLTLEKRRAWETHGSSMGGQVREVDPEDVPWPEAAYADDEQTDTAQQSTGDVVVEADGGDLDQPELSSWL